MPSFYALSRFMPLNGTTHSYFHGKIHAVRISSRALYTKNFTPPGTFQSDDSTVVLYLMNEGQGNTLNDISGNNLHGVIHGARWIPAEEAP